MWAVGNIRCDFDSAVDGTGSQQQYMRLRSLHSITSHGKQTGVFVDGWKQSSALAFELNAQQIQHITFGQDIIKSVGDTDAKGFNPRRHQRRWTANDHLGAEFSQPMNVAASHSA